MNEFTVGQPVCWFNIRSENDAIDINEIELCFGDITKIDGCYITIDDDIYVYDTDLYKSDRDAITALRNLFCIEPENLLIGEGNE